MTLFGNRVFTDVIKLRWGHWGGSKFTMSSILIKKGSWTQTCAQEECHVKMKAEREVTWQKPRNTKEGQKTISNQERDMGQILPHNPRRNQPRWHLELELPASRTVPNTVLIFKAVVPNLFGIRDQFHGRQFFHGLGNGGWFLDDSTALHFLCTLFQLLLHQLHHRSSGIRSQRVGTPGLRHSVCNTLLRHPKETDTDVLIPLRLGT